MTTLDWCLFALIGVLLVLPPKYDPAIRFKEWLDKDEPK